MELTVDELDSEDHSCAADKANKDRTGRRYHVATGSDTYKASKDAVEGEGEGRFAIFDPAYNDGHEATSACGEVGGEEYVGDGVLVVGGRCGELRTRVEPEPAEPEYEYAEGGNGEAMTRDGLRRTVLMILADTGTYYGRTYEGDPTANGVNHGGAGKVVESSAEGAHHERVRISVAEPSAAPCPVA